MTTLTINGEPRDISAPDSSPLLWALREELGLTGTKFGCGIGQCGACTVLLDGAPVRSCQVPVGSVQDTTVTTIEGVAGAGVLHPIQQAWIEEQVPQCGYCQSGQIISALALLDERAAPTDDDIDRAMSGNVCRCGAYQAIRRAIHRAVAIRSERIASDEPDQGEGDG